MPDGPDPAADPSIAGLPDLPGYRVERRLGVGGFATVYLAQQLRLNRPVALKVMNRELSDNQNFATRFLREGRDMALVSNHPNIVTVYDIDRAGDRYFIAMQYVPGPTLKDLLRDSAPYQHPLHIVRRIAGALAYAHDKGLVHRDIKPANILFNERSEAVLSDFGIAKAAGRENDLTEIGAVIGTAAYMSPEQAQGLANLDGRSDLYSLGVVLYELLTGEQPYRGDHPTATLLKHLNDPVPVLPDEEAEFQPLIDGLMAKRPEDRYPDGRALITDIERRYLQSAQHALSRQHDDTVAHPPTGSRSSVRPSKPRATPRAKPRPRRRWLLITLGGVLVLAAAVSFTPIGSMLSELTGMAPAPVAPAEPDDPLADLDADTRAKVENLLGVAEYYESVGRIREPPGANAIEALQSVLAIHPGNPAATRALQRLEAESP